MSNARDIKHSSADLRYRAVSPVQGIYGGSFVMQYIILSTVQGIYRGSFVMQYNILSTVRTNIVYICQRVYTSLSHVSRS